MNESPFEAAMRRAAIGERARRNMLLDYVDNISRDHCWLYALIENQRIHQRCHPAWQWLGYVPLKARA